MLLYSALVEDEERQPHLRKVLVTGVRDEGEARRLLWRAGRKVLSLGLVMGVEIIIGDWDGGREPEEAA